MRATGTLVGAHRGWTRRMAGRRHRWHLRIDSLEGRDLLSVIATIRSGRLDLPAGLAVSADVSESPASRESSHTVSGESGADSATHGPHPSVGSAPAASAGRGNAGGGGAFRRAGLQLIEARGPLDEFTARGPADPTTADDPADVEPDLLGVGGRAVVDPALAGLVVGWESDESGQIAASVGLASDRIAGLGGWARPAANVFPTASLPTGSTAYVLTDLDPWPVEPGARTGPPGDQLHTLSILAEAADSEENATARARLLDSATPADWEEIDREMRQLLAGIGGLAELPKVRQAGRVWLPLIGAAALLYLTHRATTGRRRLFRRASPRTRWPAHPPLPVGPWPLSPP